MLKFLFIDKRVILNWFILAFFSLSGYSQSKIIGDSLHFNHTSSIEVLEKGSILPSNDTLKSNRIIVVAFGGRIEGDSDNTIWCRLSDDEGMSWTQHKTLTNEPYYYHGDTLARDPLLFALPSKELVVIFRVQNKMGNISSTGNMIPFYKKSLDGGLTWTTSIILKDNNLEPDTNIRNYTPISPPVVFKDSLFFPFYYRLKGNARTYFAILVSNLDFTVHYFRKYPEIGLVQADPNTVIINESTIVKEGMGLKVYFRSNQGFITSCSSNDGITWSDVSLSEMPNPNSKIQFLNKDIGYSGVFNCNSLIRDNLIYFNQIERKSFVIDKFKEAGEIQVSYPSFKLLDTILYVTNTRYINQINGPLKGSILFTRVSLSQISNPINSTVKVNSSWKLNTSSSIRSVCEKDQFVYLLSRKDTVYRFNKIDKSIQTIIAQPYTFIDKSLSIDVSNGFLYVVGQVPYLYKKINLSDLSSTNNTSIPLACRKIKIKNGNIYLEALDGKSVFIVNELTESITDTVVLPENEKFANWIINDSNLFIFSDKNIIYQKPLHGSAGLVKVSSLPGLGKFIGFDSDEVLFYNHDSVYALNTLNDSINYLAIYPNSYNPQYFQGFWNNNKFYFSDLLGVLCYDPQKLSFETILDSIGFQEYVLISPYQNKAFIFSSSGRIYEAEIGLGPTINPKIESELKLLVNPNPFSESLNVLSSERIGRIEIYDIKGVQMESTQIARVSDFRICLNTNELLKGVYFLHVESELGNNGWYKIIQE